MTQGRISDLLATGPVDPAAHLDDARVEQLAASGDALPPVVVFQTEGGHALVYAAAVGARAARRDDQRGHGTHPGAQLAPNAVARLRMAKVQRFLRRAGGRGS